MNIPKRTLRFGRIRRTIGLKPDHLKDHCNTAIDVRQTVEPEALLHFGIIGEFRVIRSAIVAGRIISEGEFVIANLKHTQNCNSDPTYFVDPLNVKIAFQVIT